MVQGSIKSSLPSKEGLETGKVVSSEDYLVTVRVTVEIINIRTGHLKRKRALLCFADLGVTVGPYSGALRTWAAQRR
jgi:hypothetical protein